MNEQAAAVLLGVVQGITEFLPISSSGHLIIAGSLLGLDGDRYKIFEVAIQFGSILAVIALYFRRFLALVPLPGKTRDEAQSPFSGFRGLRLLFLTCLPAGLLGLFCHSYIMEHLFHPLSVSCALAVGALFILFAEKRSTTHPADNPVTSLDHMTPRLAIGIGLFQCLSLWPGFSRSTSTIMGGMLLGANRATAAEYSFIAAVPIMCAATGFAVLRNLDVLSAADIPFFATGMIVSFFSALLAIKILVRLISRFSFACFAWYRLLLAPLVFWFWA